MKLFKIMIGSFPLYINKNNIETITSAFDFDFNNNTEVSVYLIKMVSGTNISIDKKQYIELIKELEVIK